jgi:short-subunit dehydrogenase
MRAFSYQLAADLRGTGVGVTLLAPAEVDSPYFEHNPGARERIPRVGRIIGALTPDQVARHAANAIERERRELILPWRARWVLRLTPEFVMRGLLGATGWRRQPAGSA